VWLAWRSLFAGPDLARVRREDLVLTVEVAGALKAVESEVFGPPPLPNVWQYKIAMMETEGVQVKKGQPVLGFDTTDLARELDDKQAESEEARKQIEKRQVELAIDREDRKLKLAEARVSLDKAKLKLEVPAELKAANELAKARVDKELAERELARLQAEDSAALKAGEAEVATLREIASRAEKRVQEIKDSIARMTILAPRDGTVIYYTNEWDTTKKKVGDSCWRGERVMEIPDLSRMKGEGQVDEADAGRIAEGQRVTLKLDAHPDVEFTGKVQSIWKSVQTSPPGSRIKVVKLDVALDVTDTRRMMPGMRFRGEVEVGRVAGALVAPAGTVFATEKGPLAYKKTILLGLRPRALTLGARTAEAVQVLSGLSEGDLVSRRPPAAKEAKP